MQPWLDWFQAEYEDVRILKQTAASRIGLCRHRKTGMELVRLDLENTNEEVYRRLLPLEHPCLPRIYEVRADGDRLIVLEEFVDGVTLAQRMKQGAVSGKEARRYMLGLCDALEILHDACIVYRDIKPSNILITNDGTITLIDFHISRIRSGFQERDTQVAGTVGYAPPEQFGLSATEPRADIYALGVLFNQMLSGEHPSVRDVPGIPRPHCSKMYAHGCGIPVSFRCLPEESLAALARLPSQIKISDRLPSSA